MKITIIAVGKLKERYLKEGISEYANRIARFCDLEIIEVNDEQASEKISKAQELQIMKKEAESILKKFKSSSLMIVLDLKGEEVDSEGFADKLKTFFVSGQSHLTFIIGGSLGLDESLRNMAQLRFSMSLLTFPHQLARLILIEQVYRALKIINGETYHK